MYTWSWAPTPRRHRLYRLGFVRGSNFRRGLGPSAGTWVLEAASQETPKPYREWGSRSFHVDF